MGRIGRVRAAALSLLVGPVAAFAAADAFAETQTYDTYADVVSVTPLYRWRDVVEPVRRCEAAPAHYPSSYTYRQVDDYRYGQAYAYDRPYHRSYDRRHDGRGAGASLIGGLIGGLVGNQFGGGSGKTVLTVAGAALGASIARDHVREHHTVGYDEYRPPAVPRYGTVVQRCTETEQTRLVRDVAGYDVTYRYHGQTFHKRVEDHPGERIRIHVNVEPDGAS